MNQVQLDKLVKPHTCVVMASNCICHSTVFHRINIATKKNTEYYPFPNRDRKACMDSLGGGGSATESTRHERWNEKGKQLLRLFLRPVSTFHVPNLM